MGCFLNHCSENFAAEIKVIGLYGVAVFIMIALSILARSKSIRTAATLIGVTWALGIFGFFYLNIEGYFLFAVMLDTIVAHQFWRMSKVSIFPAPLCILMLFEITFIIFAKSIGFGNYGTVFALNRLFELTLLYIIGCSLFRIVVRAMREYLEKSRRNDQ